MTRFWNKYQQVCS